MTSLVNHPDRAEITARLKTNIVLRSIKPRAFGELEKLLSIVDYRKGDVLISQGDHEMEQYFIIEGVLKREVEKGGTAANIKTAMDRAIEQIQTETSGSRDRARDAVARATDKLRNRFEGPGKP